MSNLKPQPTRQIQHELRTQRTQKGNAWTAFPFYGTVISASESASRGRDVLGRRVTPQETNEHNGGDDEQ